MTTPDPRSATPVVLAGTQPFVPDAAAIERLANALFQSRSPAPAPVAEPSGVLAATPSPAPPAASAFAEGVPGRPPFVMPGEPPAAPSPLPTRLLGVAAAEPRRPAVAPLAGAAPPGWTTGAGLVAGEPWRSTLPDLVSLGAASAPGADAALAPFSGDINWQAAFDVFAAALRPAATAQPAKSPPIEREVASEDTNHLVGPAPAAHQAAPGADAPYFLHDAAREPSRPGASRSEGALAPTPAKLDEQAAGRRVFDAATIRNDFPILRETIHGRRLIWLDNGATTQKPQAVIDRLAHFYAHENSNVHRGAHTLAARATDAYEEAREKVRRFLGAASAREIVFVRGATEGINLVAQSWGRRNVKAGDEIVVTWLEHHANIVPWQQLCAETGARLRVAPVDDNGDIRLEEYEKLLGPRTRLVAFTQVSNAIGTVTPAREMIAPAHRHGALTLIDGAQSVAHMRTDVQALDADFFVLSGHKMFGPTGIGALYGKATLLEAMPPWQGGGNMIEDVTFERTRYQGAPERFEAGTGNIADAVGLGAAINYLEAIGLESAARHEHELVERALEGLGAIRGLRLIGAPRERASVVSFVLDGCRSEDIGKALDREGIAVRSGHHCAQPILRRFGLESTVRASFALYNTRDDVDALIATVRRIALQAQGGAR